MGTESDIDTIIKDLLTSEDICDHCINNPLNLRNKSRFSLLLKRMTYWVKFPPSHAYGDGCCEIGDAVAEARVRILAPPLQYHCELCGKPVGYDVGVKYPNGGIIVYQHEYCRLCGRDLVKKFFDKLGDLLGT